MGSVSYVLVLVSLLHCKIVLDKIIWRRIGTTGVDLY